MCAREADTPSQGGVSRPTVVVSLSCRRVASPPPSRWAKATSRSTTTQTPDPGVEEGPVTHRRGSAPSVPVTTSPALACSTDTPQRSGSTMLHQDSGRNVAWSAASLVRPRRAVVTPSRFAYPTISGTSTARRPTERATGRSATTCAPCWRKSTTCGCRSTRIPAELVDNSNCHGLDRPLETKKATPGAWRLGGVASPTHERISCTRSPRGYRTLTHSSVSPRFGVSSRFGSDT